MKQIAGTKKYQTGCGFWTDGGKELSDFFPFEELIDMKINALTCWKIRKYTGSMEKTTGLNPRFNVPGIVKTR